MSICFQFGEMFIQLTNMEINIKKNLDMIRENIENLGEYNQQRFDLTQPDNRVIANEQLVRIFWGSPQEYTEQLMERSPSLLTDLRMILDEVRIKEGYLQLTAMILLGEEDGSPCFETLDLVQLFDHLVIDFIDNKSDDFTGFDRSSILPTAFSLRSSHDSLTNQILEIESYRALDYSPEPQLL